RDDKNHSQALDEEYHCQQAKSQILEDDFDKQIHGALEDKFKDDGELSTPIQSQIQYDSGSAQGSQLHKTNKRGAESQVTQLLSQQDSKTNSSISRLEDVLIKNKLENLVMKDVIKEINGVKCLLTQDEQVQQAQVNAQLKVCQLEVAQLDVKKTKQAMELELAIAKGQFISQFMKDNKVNYKAAKLIADDLYKGMENMYIPFLAILMYHTHLKLIRLLNQVCKQFKI
ncbi:hypothetical protein DFH28DRAFT_885049, partial [Melampsora americana]